MMKRGVWRSGGGAIRPAPPLNRVETVSVLTLVFAGVVIGIAFIALRGAGDVLQSISELIVTALFAGFLFSPALTVLALTVAMALALWGGWAPEMLLALAVATSLVARLGSNRLFVSFGGIFLVSVAAAILTSESDQLNAIVVYLLVATISGAIGLLLRFARSREQHLVAELTERALAEQAIRQSERLLIADELHDVISHDLTVIVMQTELIQIENGSDALSPSQRSIRESARKALGDLHRLVQSAHDLSARAETPQLSFDESLRDTERELADAGCSLSTTIQDGPGLPRIVDTTLARILRESVTNILKHSGATSARVVLARDGDDVILTVRNTMSRRRTSSPVVSTGHGSLRIAERVALLGGAFQSEPDGREWVVTARLPAG